MKSRIIKIFFAAFIAIAAVSAQADTETVNGITWTYTVTDGKASVGGESASSPAVPTSTSGAITIPSTLGGYPVASIGYCAFWDCSSLTSLTIPDSVTSIGRHAFTWCDSLTSVTIGDSVTSIGGSAFYGCSSLKDVHISDLAKWCNIEFENDEANPLYYAHNLYLNGNKVTQLVIPDGVTSIRFYAFYNCSSLTSVTIPDSVTSIGDSAFEGCSGLADSNGFVIVKGVLYDYFGEGGDVVIPNGVTSIGGRAFFCCDSLTSVTIGKCVTSIGGSALSGCSSLTSVTIPNSVTNIGGYAFRDCSSLTSVTIPDSVTSIGDEAFYGCSSLSSVKIGNGVRTTGESVFHETPFQGRINAEIFKLVSQKLSDDGGSQGGSSGSSEGGGATATPPANADIGYNLTESVEDRSISNIEINGDRALDEFVLKDGKVYDCVIRVVNVSDNEAKVTLPTGYEYETIGDVSPLVFPAKSKSMLTITRTAPKTFLVTRQPLRAIQ